MPRWCHSSAVVRYRRVQPALVPRRTALEHDMAATPGRLGASTHDGRSPCMLASQPLAADALCASDGVASRCVRLMAGRRRVLAGRAGWLAA